jgi:hypothetical protein
MADFGAQGQKPEGLLDAAQGEVERLGVFAFEEETVQTGLQEFQLIQFRSELGLLGLVVLGLQVAAEMLHMAGQGRRGEAVEVRQGAQGHAIHQGAVDLGEGRVVADGTESGPQARVSRKFFRHVGHSLGF